jgi:hypothetical protein
MPAKMNEYRPTPLGEIITLLPDEVCEHWIKKRKKIISSSLAS